MSMQSIILCEVLPKLRAEKLSDKNVLIPSNYTDLFEVLEKAYDEVLNFTYVEMATKYESEPDHISLPIMEEQDQADFAILNSLYLYKDSDIEYMEDEDIIEDQVQSVINCVEHQVLHNVLQNNFDEVKKEFIQDYKEVWIGRERKNFYYKN